MNPRTTVFAAIPMLVAAVALSVPAARADSDVHSAQDRVNDAVKIVHKMKESPRLAALLDRADGVFIIPHYGKAGFIVGGQGGGGVVLAHKDGQWSDPAFYSIGGASIGAQIGGEGGAVAMLLMTPKAMQKFEDSSGTWSLNANAGLTVVAYSGKAQANSNNGDVIMWSDTNGLYGGLTAGVTDITPDSKMDRGYYQEKTNSRAILSDSVTSSHADALKQALQMQVAER